jgi:hypothetical protein
MDPGRSVIRKYWIPKDQIFYVKFLLEGYEGMVIQTSQPGSPVVSWEIPEGLATEAEALAEALADEVGLIRLEDET